MKSLTRQTLVDQLDRSWEYLESALIDRQYYNEHGYRSDDPELVFASRAVEELYETIDRIEARLGYDR